MSTTYWAVDRSGWKKARDMRNARQPADETMETFSMLGGRGMVPVLAPIWRFARRKPVGFVAGLVLLALLVVGLAAPMIAPYDVTRLDATAKSTAPSGRHWFGTDPLGRDVLSQVIRGARVSIYVGIGSVLAGTTLGSLFGIATAYYGGKLDLFGQRLIDVLQAYPTLLFALALVSALGPGVFTVVAAIATALFGASARVTRSVSLSIKEETYVEAALAVGCSGKRILLGHVLPNCVAPYLIMATAGLGTAILSEASLSFLGLGIPLTTPTWGGMLSGLGRESMERAPWVALFPGAAITLAVLAANLFGDALRDVWDPRLRSR
ncbi:MAG: ABC transporter permease [Chloroflexi bacterium]|nr:ABC transporter permease [Chloroflexota bacterium]